MNALAAAGHRNGIVTDVAKDVAHQHGDLGALGQRDPRSGVEIEDEPIGIAWPPFGSELPLRYVNLQCRKLSQPGQRGEVIDHRVVVVMIPVLDLVALDPVGCSFGEILVEEDGRLLVAGAHPVRPAFAGGRTITQVRKHHPGNLRVVGQHVGLGGLRCRVQHLVEVGELDGTAVDRHRLIHGGGHETSIPPRPSFQPRAGRHIALYRRSMRAIWKGAISFGLVNVPIRLYSATEDHDVDLHQVHDEDGGRIRYERRCEKCGKVVEYAHIDKAFAEGSTTVVLTEEDLKSLPEERSREIEVVEFVPSEQIDPIMFDRSYFLEPEKLAVKAYALLRRTLEETDRTAIVQFSLRQKTRLGALRARDKVLMLQSLLWDDEVREADFGDLDSDVRVSAQELKMSASLVDNMSTDFAPDKFSDEYQEQLRQLIAAKLEKGDALDTAETFGEEPKTTSDADVIDLMEALRQSVERNKAARAGQQKTAAKRGGSASGKAAVQKASDNKPSGKKTPGKKAPAKKAPAKKNARAAKKAS